MKILCKCGEILSKDVYPSKKPIKVDYDESGEYIDEYHRPGCFYTTQRSLELWISVEDYLPEIPSFRSGWGCCNWSFGYDTDCPSCGKLIGGLYLDCYEDKSVCLFKKEVVRKYDQS